MLRPRFPVLCVCLLVQVFVSVVFSLPSDGRPQEPVSHHVASLAQVLGKEYVLFPSEQNMKTFHDREYSYCDACSLYRLWEEYPIVTILTKEDGEFLITSKIELYHLKFQLGKEFWYGRGNSKPKMFMATLNGTAFTLIEDYRPVTSEHGAVLTMNFTSDDKMEMEGFSTVGPQKFTSSQTKHNVTTVQQNHTSSSLLAATFGKEYVFDEVFSNGEIIKYSMLPECLRGYNFILNFLVAKLNWENERFELILDISLFYERFQLDTQYESRFGSVFKYFLNGTTLTRVSCRIRNLSLCSTNVWRFGPEELQTEITGYNTSLIYRTRK